MIILFNIVDTFIFFRLRICTITSNVNVCLPLTNFTNNEFNIQLLKRHNKTTRCFSLQDKWVPDNPTNRCVKHLWYFQANEDLFFITIIDEVCRFHFGCSSCSYVYYIYAIFSLLTVYIHNCNQFLKFANKNMSESFIEANVLKHVCLWFQ